MSSTSDGGHAAITSRKNKIEYLGEGGIMEYGSDMPQKRVIDCLAEGQGQQESSFTYLSFDNYNNDNPDASCDDECMWEEKDSEQGYSLRALSAETLDADYFSGADDDEHFSEEDVLTWACDRLKSSTNARLMLKEAAEKGWLVVLEDLDGGDYCMNVEEHLLVLDNNSLSANGLARSEYFLSRLLVTMTKALRDVWQEKRHGGFDEDYAPKDVILMERVRAADLDITGLLVAWELRGQGMEECWRHLMGSENGDIAMAFSGYLERKPTASLDLRQALLAAFRQWFHDAGRVDACDHDTLEYLDEVLSVSEFVNPFGDKHPGKMNIEMLSSLPSKIAYLQGHGTDVLQSKTFWAITNDINRAHLTHIQNDAQSITIDNVSFRDPNLARKIFPENFAK